jgi:DNA-binding transcriptional regulator YdaS (Cro superfamily)
MKTPKDALLEAISRAGTQSKLAALVGGKVRTGHVFYWLSAGVVPKEHCPAIEAGTGVTVDELNPDTRWSRIPDPNWPHPGGRPVIDVARPIAA